MREYKTPKRWAILFIILALFIIVFSVWKLVPILNGNFEPNANWLLYPIFTATIVWMVIIVIEVFKGRLIIQENKIESISVFYKRVLAFEDIKGFTVNEQFIIIEPKNKEQKKIKIAQTIEGYSEILEWLYQNFQDLEIQNSLIEDQELLSDEAISWTKEIREEKRIKAIQITKFLNWATALSSVWALLYPKPYRYAVLTAIVLPIISLVVMKFSDGLIRFDKKNGSASPTIIYTFTLPAIVLMLRATIDYDIFDYSNVWLVTSTITLALVFIFLFKNKEITFKKKHELIVVPFVALFLFAYSFGTVIHINCYYDNSETKYYSTKILDKRIEEGSKSTKYILELSNWKQKDEVIEVKVAKSLFKRIEIGADINIYYRNGTLDIPWFIVTDK